jgi:hypothetical protein
MILDSYHVAGSNLLRTIESDESVLQDPRGFVHVWREPRPHAKYVMSCDPTVGITNWTRSSRTEGDHKTDNAAIEIFEVDAFKVLRYNKDGSPKLSEQTNQQEFYYQDVQCAEYFAPIDAVEAARVANVLGRIYAGDEDDQCEFIFESYPGPGMLTLQELLRLGYGNLWQWEKIADNVAQQTQHIGWYSGRETQKILWYRSRRHLMEDRALIYSPWLLAEYANAVLDVEKMRARAAYGMHDDLLQTANMLFWAAHKWTYDPERTNEPVTERAILDHQQYAPVLGEYRSVRDAWADAVDSW